MDSLIAVYREAFGRKPGTTINKIGSPDGPTVRWCRAILASFLRRSADAVEPSSRDTAWRQRCGLLASEHNSNPLRSAIREAKSRPDREASLPSL